ncbi:MAG: F0F1 ATP synthase subunit C [Alphaproteobacteria bacterium]|nr:F0F1 ATP synthase subunit C [Alphaproteobacteria bacterium]MBQ3117996.1 F0F1 ATP synthase subunit C [Alphaproteobacteria bacterium]MBQ6854445.1 F0F1 ATP synthase subunit C [Alphaproteobacteria bacterium]MBQ8557511.1 F0F1 ATP synthase subunit C [Alphaproteobacteria bacterium]
MDAITLIGAFSVLAAGLCISIGGIGSAIGEGNVAASALRAIAQQPDETSTITRTLFIAMAMIESTAIYSFVITVLILYFNPFWNYAIEAVAK